MKVVVLDVCSPSWLAGIDASRFENCAVIAVNSGGTDNLNAPRSAVPMTSKTATAKIQERLFEPWFDQHLEESGVRLRGAEISFLTAANCYIFFESWNYLGLLLDLEQIRRAHSIESVELITDSMQRGRSYHAVDVFAAAYGLRWRWLFVRGERGKLSHRVFDFVAEAATRIHPSLWLGLDYLRRALERRGDSNVAPVGRASAKSATIDGILTRGVDRLRVAMLVYHAKSWQYLLPIRDQLLDAGHAVHMVSPRKETDRPLTLAGCPYIALRPKATPFGWWSSVREEMRALPLNPPNDEVERIVRPGGPFRRILCRLSLQASGAYAGVASRIPTIFRRLGINVALGTDSGSVAGRSFFRTVERMGIAATFVQHGAISSGTGTFKYFTSAKRLVWGTTSQDALLDSGLTDPNSTIAIGSPYHEAALLRNPGASSVQKHGESNSVLVTFGIPGNLIARASFMLAAQEVLAAAGVLTDVQFAIRPHPGDNSSFWERLLAAHDLPNVVIRREGDTYQLMRDCRILVTMASTTGAEAILLGKPVVAVNLERHEIGIDYIAAGAAYLVSEPNRLAPLLRDLLRQPEDSDSLVETRREFARRFLYYSEAVPAVERIEKYLTSLIANRRRPNEPCAKSSNSH